MTSGIWFTSDQHYFHKNVIKYCNRPFYGNIFRKILYRVFGKVHWSAVLEMNEELIKRHNAVVGVHDTVYHLGDFSMSPTKWREILSRLNGRHILIVGNHDACHPVHGQRRAARFRDEYLKNGFCEILLETQMYIQNEKVTLHHMPFYNPSPDFDQRYPQYRPKDEGQILLHGHVHDKWKIKGRMINVGVDAWNYYPVSLEQIETLVYLMKLEWHNNQ